MTSSSNHYLFIVCLAVTVFTACQTRSPKCSYIKDYYPNIYWANYFFEREEYSEALKYYRTAFKSCEPKNTEIYYEITKAARTAAQLELKDLSLYYLQLAFENGTPINELEQPYYTLLSNENDSVLIHESFKEGNNLFTRKLDLKLRNDIREMLKNDQLYRRPNSSLEKNIQDSIDIVNESKVYNILENYGFPNYNIIGSVNIDGENITITPILFHMSDSFKTEYLFSKIYDEIEKGNASPKILGELIDLYLLQSGEQQKYGTIQQQSKDFEDFRSTNQNFVDSLRLSIGLPPYFLRK